MQKLSNISDKKALDSKPKLDIYDYGLGEKGMIDLIFGLAIGFCIGVIYNIIRSKTKYFD